MGDCSVHKYKWSQNKRRAMLKKLRKEGSVKKTNENKTHMFFKILNMDRYRELKR